MIYGFSKTWDPRSAFAVNRVEFDQNMPPATAESSLYWVGWRGRLWAVSLDTVKPPWLPVSTRNGCDSPLNSMDTSGQPPLREIEDQGECLVAVAVSSLWSRTRTFFEKSIVTTCSPKCRIPQMPPIKGSRLTQKNGFPKSPRTAGWRWPSPCGQRRIFLKRSAPKRRSSWLPFQFLGAGVAR